MPLEPYQYQPAGSKASTPSPTIPQGGHGRRASASSLWSSPESVETRATTPNISPLKGQGRDLLPRIRAETVDPESAGSFSHRRALLQDFDLDLSSPTSRPGYQRACTAPPESEALQTPISSDASQDPWAFPDFETPLSYTAAPFSSGHLGHARSISASALDPSAFRRHAFPYRTVPQYITKAQTPQYTPQVVQPQLLDFVSNPFEISQPCHPLSRGLTPELLVETGDEPTTTVLSYLTTPNPTISLVPRDAPRVGDATAKHCWWDIRQIRPWTSFNLSTILSIPSFSDILSISINSAALPSPAPLPRDSLAPTRLQDLHSTTQKHLITKLNSALKASRYGKYPLITSTTTSRDGPQFFCQWANEDGTIPCRRGRAVGLCKSYEDWNTGMRDRHNDPNARVRYLRALSQLHWLMREQECRYGYIITEIELLCVRIPTAPAPSTSTSSSSTHQKAHASNTPLFGTLELATPIPLSVSSSPQGDDDVASNLGLSEEKSELTAGLALWYLHMLTGDTPLPGELPYSMHVGAPAEHTRSTCCEDGERDGWISGIKGPNGHEVRPAKRVRGWVWPGDEYKPKIEGGRPRTRR